MLFFIRKCKETQCVCTLGKIKNFREIGDFHWKSSVLLRKHTFLIEHRCVANRKLDLLVVSGLVFVCLGFYFSCLGLYFVSVLVCLDVWACILCVWACICVSGLGPWVSRLVFLCVWTHTWMSIGVSGLYFGCLDLYFWCLDLYLYVCTCIFDVCTCISVVWALFWIAVLVFWMMFCCMLLRFCAVLYQFDAISAILNRF